MISSDAKFTFRRKELRNNPTPEEELLWQYLRGKKLGYKFRRQHSLGPYITDFYCFTKKLVIELDGNFHKTNIEYDSERTQYLEALGCRVLRFKNIEVQSDVDKVINTINSSSQPHRLM